MDPGSGVYANWLEHHRGLLCHQRLQRASVLGGSVWPENFCRASQPVVAGAEQPPLEAGGAARDGRSSELAQGRAILPETGERRAERLHHLPRAAEARGCRAPNTWRKLPANCSARAGSKSECGRQNCRQHSGASTKPLPAQSRLQRRKYFATPNINVRSTLRLCARTLGARRPSAEHCAPKHHAGARLARSTESEDTTLSGEARESGGDGVTRCMYGK